MTLHPMPPLELEAWKETRDTLHAYARVLGAIRRALSPHQKHWGHISLIPAASGLTTMPIPGGRGAFELTLGLAGHALSLTTSWGEAVRVPLRGQSVAELCGTVREWLEGWGIEVALDPALCSDEHPRAYDENDVARFWEALTRVHLVFQRFKGGLREETSPVQLWPHHFDLAMLWFSGRRVGGAGEGEEEADEQMNFGFSTGDQSVAEPYFYATAYPLPEGLSRAPLPPPAEWNSQGWQGGRLLYGSLLQHQDPEGALLDFLQALQRAGASLMHERREST